MSLKLSLIISPQFVVLANNEFEHFPYSFRWFPTLPHISRTSTVGWAKRGFGLFVHLVVVCFFLITPVPKTGNSQAAQASI